jgi:ribosomal protein S18 acetylase RimI-like enzyme
VLKMEFKIYEESRLEDLGKLVKDVVKDWPQDPWYPTMEQLKEVYENNENFTPETRHFLYDGDKLVAFLSSALEGEENEDGVIWGSIHMPFIRKGYEVEQKLFDKTISVLKEKGAQKIRAYARPEYGYIPKLLKKWGFEKTEETGKRIILKAKDFVDDKFEKPDYFYELDLKDDKHLEKFKKAYLKARTEVTEENFDQTMATFRERELTISCVIAKKDEILSYGLFYKADQPGRSFLSSIPVFNKEHKYILKEMVTFMANKAKKEGYEEIYHGLVDEENEDLYKKMGIEFAPSARYELKL